MKVKNLVLSGILGLAVLCSGCDVPEASSNEQRASFSLKKGHEFFDLVHPYNLDDVRERYLDKTVLITGRISHYDPNLTDSNYRSVLSDASAYSIGFVMDIDSNNKIYLLMVKGEARDIHTLIGYERTFRGKIGYITNKQNGLGIMNTNIYIVRCELVK